MRITLALILCSAFCSSGCAALSLFDSTHTHTHYHSCNLDDADERVSILEDRIQQLEQRQGNLSTTSNETQKPVEMSRETGGQTWIPIDNFGPTNTDSAR